MKSSLLDRRPGLILASIAFVLNLLPSISGFTNRNYDSWSHLFFASHYMHSWFNTWEPRWFGGFSVTSYPPLVTQLLALGGFAFGLEYSYVLLNLIVMILLPVAMYLFCVNFLPRRRAFYAGLILLLLPSLYLSAYTYGQIPTIFALTTSLFMGSYFWQYLKSNRWQDLAAASVLAGITMSSHHYTFLCFVPSIVAVVVFSWYFSTRPPLYQAIRRVGLFILLSVPLVTIPVLPFWQYVLKGIPQVPVFHLTRVNYLMNGEAFLKFFVGPYLLLVFTLPLVALNVFKNKRLLPLFIIFLILFVLGLGGTTPLPKLIFGHYWLWLTYDRFALWAGVLAAPLLAVLMPESIAVNVPSLRRVTYVILSLGIVIQFIGCAFFASEPSRLSFLPNPPEVSVSLVIEFLNSDQVGQQYRYLTLGFAEPQMEKVSTLTTANSLDGIWIPGRNLPVLTQSGLSTIDSSKFNDPELITLNQILSHAAQYSLKWVLVNDWYYKDILEQNGFKLFDSNDLSMDDRFGALTIWEKDDIPALTGETRQETGLTSIIWGIGPLLLLVSLLFIILSKHNTNSKPIHPFEKAVGSENRN